MPRRASRLNMRRSDSSASAVLAASAAAFIPQQRRREERINFEELDGVSCKRNGSADSRRSAREKKIRYNNCDTYLICFGVHKLWLPFREITHRMKQSPRACAGCCGGGAPPPPQQSGRRRGMLPSSSTTSTASSCISGCPRPKRKIVPRAKVDMNVTAPPPAEHRGANTNVGRRGGNSVRGKMPKPARKMKNVDANRPRYVYFKIEN